MAKKSKKSEMPSVMPGEEDWQNREDVSTILRYDEICNDEKRFARAKNRLTSAARHVTRKGSRSSGR